MHQRHFNLNTKIRRKVDNIKIKFNNYIQTSYYVAESETISKPKIHQNRIELFLKLAEILTMRP